MARASTISSAMRQIKLQSLVSCSICREQHFRIHDVFAEYQPSPDLPQSMATECQGGHRRCGD